MEWLKVTVDYGIIGFLIILSIITVAIAIERYLLYRHIKSDNFSDRRELELELTKKLHIIATIGSNAPYIGLLYRSIRDSPRDHAHILYNGKRGVC